MGRLLLVLVLLAVASLPLLRYLRTPVEARQAAAGLRSSAVYVAPGTAVVDAARVRQVVGDRPIVVAVLAASFTGRVLDGCRGIARQQPRNLVLAYRGARPGEYPAICAGRRFPEPHLPEPTTDLLGSRTDLWLYGLGNTAARSSGLRLSRLVADRTPEVEELVLAFDAQVRQDYPDGVPRRVPAPEPQTLARVLLQLLGLAGGLLLAFALLRHAALRLHRARQAARGLRDARAELDDRLSSITPLLLGDRPVQVREAERQAEVAELYLAALSDVEHAHTAAELVLAQRSVAAAQRAARR